MDSDRCSYLRVLLTRMTRTQRESFANEFRMTFKVGAELPGDVRESLQRGLGADLLEDCLGSSDVRRAVMRIINDSLVLEGV